MTGSLAAAVFLRGGVYARQWEWSALGISVAAILVLGSASPRDLLFRKQWGFAVLALLLGWMLIQITPLPPAAVAFLSPHRWQAVHDSREVAGFDDRSWTTLSVAPPATLGRLLDVAPAMAAFIAAGQLAWFWRGRIWLLVAPVVMIGWLQAVVGLSQFYSMREVRVKSEVISGTYIYHNHFSGLLEIALFPAIWWAVSTWRAGTNRQTQAAVPALKVVLYAGMAACLLAGIVVSQSRMGFVSTIAAVAATLLLLLTSLATTKIRALAVLVIIGVIASLLIFLPTQELVARFGELAAEDDLAKDARALIWQNTTHLIANYPWTGVGLGAYEHGLYEFKTASPLNTVDYAHNDYLQVLGELGIPGAALLGALAVWIVGRALSFATTMRRRSNWELSMGLVGTFLVLGLHSLADFNLYLPANAVALAWFAGIAVSLGAKGQPG